VLLKFTFLWWGENSRGGARGRRTNHWPEPGGSRIAWLDWDFLLFFLFRRLSCPTFSLAFSTVGRSGGVLLVYFVIGPLFLLCLGRVGLADMNVLGVDR